MDINENLVGGNGEKEVKLLLLGLIANHLVICCQIMYHLYDSVLIRCALITQTPCAFNTGRMF